MTLNAKVVTVNTPYCSINPSGTTPVCSAVAGSLIAVNEGVVLAEYTPEAVASQWAAIRDDAKLRVPRDGTDYWGMVQKAIGAA